jgi:hypothetical protein
MYFKAGKFLRGGFAVLNHATAIYLLSKPFSYPHGKWALDLIIDIVARNRGVLYFMRGIEGFHTKSCTFSCIICLKIRDLACSNTKLHFWGSAF